MKLLLVTRTASLVLLFGAAFPAAAQKSGAGKPDGHEAKQDKQPQDKGQSGKPDGHEAQQGKQPHEKEQQNREQGIKQDEPGRKPRSSDRNKPSQKPPERDNGPKRSVQQSRAWQSQKGWAKNGGWKGQKSWKGHRSDNWEHDHYTWIQRGGYGGYYIPQYYYTQYYGPSHYFRMRGRPVMYMGYPRFYYRDYSYIMVDPWPSTWQENWYESEDVYIVYDDGYYLYNRSAPSVGIAISVIR